MKRLIALTMCIMAVMAGGCVGEGQYKEAKEGQANLQTQLSAAQKERDDWKSRYDQLRVEADAMKMKSTDYDKKLADRDATASAQKADLDSANANVRKRREFGDGFARGPARFDGGDGVHQSAQVRGLGVRRRGILR